MTKVQATALQEQWTKQIDPVPCGHTKQEMEHTDTGYLTGIYYCAACGESVARP